MQRELIYTAVIYALLAIAAATSWPGAILAGGWIIGGIYMVVNSRSRGLLADLSFIATWPLYMAVGR